MKRFLLLTVIVLFAATYVSAMTINGVQIDADSAKCITCHEDMGIAPKVHDSWASSAHAKNGVGCLSCHAAEEGDFDAMKCPNSDVLIGSQPTPKDCAQCH